MKGNDERVGYIMGVVQELDSRRDLYEHAGELAAIKKTAEREKARHEQGPPLAGPVFSTGGVA